MVPVVRKDTDSTGMETRDVNGDEEERWSLRYEDEGDNELGDGDIDEG